MTSARDSQPLLAVDRASVRYGRNEVLHSVSLELRQGEFLLLVGPNGAGKSTLLKAIVGLVPLCSGQIRFAGRDVSGWPTPRRARAGLSLALQGGAVFGSLTAREHVELARDAAEHQSTDARTPTVDRLLHNLWARQTGAGKLSGGERQSVAIATVLAQRPRLLLCDEPTAGLAPSLARELLTLVARLCRQDGVAVIWVEHRTREILPLVDRAVLLDSGVVAATTDQPSCWIDGGPLSKSTFGAEAGGGS